MLTAMILPEDTFSNVTIDNGKVISDGSRNIVVGVGMPGLKDSLKLDTLSLSTDDEDKNSEDKTLDIDIPDSVSIEADVTDFSMSSSLTVALSDLLKDIDFDDDSACLLYTAYSKVDMIGSICTLLSRGALISVVVVAFVLPAMFLIFDKVICKTSINFLGKK